MTSRDLSLWRVSTAAWACIEFLHRYTQANFCLEVHQVSTAAWACIEFLLEALAYMTADREAGVSTAAWACIEFLHYNEMSEEVVNVFVSQQPLGLALSFYQFVDSVWASRFALSGLNSRLGLH